MFTQHCIHSLGLFNVLNSSLPARSKVKWAGHMVRMDADTLVKRMEEKGEKTSRMQEKGNEQLRSKDCVRWDMRRSGEDERWRGGSR